MARISKLADEQKKMTGELATAIDQVRDQYLKLKEAMDSEGLFTNVYLHKDLKEIEEMCVKAGLLEPGTDQADRVDQARDTFYRMVADYYPDLQSPTAETLSSTGFRGKAGPEKQNRMSVGFAGELIHSLHELRQSTRRDVLDKELSDFFHKRVFTEEHSFTEEEFQTVDRAEHAGLKKEYGRVWAQVDCAIEESVPIIRE